MVSTNQCFHQDTISRKTATQSWRVLSTNETDYPCRTPTRYFKVSGRLPLKNYYCYSLLLLLFLLLLLLFIITIITTTIINTTNIIIIVIIIIIISSVNKNQIYLTYPIFVFLNLAFGGYCLHFQVYAINSMI